MLRGMGFSNKTAIFLASGKIYRAEKNMASLLEMFPLLQTKETSIRRGTCSIQGRNCRVSYIFFVLYFHTLIVLKRLIIARISPQGWLLLTIVFVPKVKFL